MRPVEKRLMFFHFNVLTEVKGCPQQVCPHGIRLCIGVDEFARRATRRFSIPVL
jgi:hypothetical protein